MKMSLLTEEQIVAILREHEEDVATAEACRRHGISSATLLKLEIQVLRHGCFRCPRGTTGQPPGPREAFTIDPSTPWTSYWTPSLRPARSTPEEAARRQCKINRFKSSWLWEPTPRHATREAAGLPLN